MKKQVLCQVTQNGRIIDIYESPEQASIDDRNRFDPHEIRIALEAKITYRGFKWKWLTQDSIDVLKKFTQGL